MRWEVSFEVKFEDADPEKIKRAETFLRKKGLVSCSSGTCFVFGGSRDVQYRFTSKKKAEEARDLVKAVLDRRGIKHTLTLEEV